ncbi:MAG: hypothetical protein NNA18_08955 [Nitrospira sp.]|nr:hypothetical protein [Nitrospira sp.]
MCKIKKNPRNLSRWPLQHHGGLCQFDAPDNGTVGRFSAANYATAKRFAKEKRFHCRDLLSESGFSTGRLRMPGVWRMFGRRSSCSTGLANS